MPVRLDVVLSDELADVRRELAKGEAAGWPNDVTRKNLWDLGVLCVGA